MLRSKRWWLAAVGVLVTACSNGHDSLSSDVRFLRFEDSFEFLVERRIGPDRCFMADCPAVVRYYLSDQDPELTCRELGGRLDGTGLSLDRTLGAETCRYLGVVGSVLVDVRADNPITEIPPDDQTLYPFPVTAPHDAVVVVRASRA
jgi:hypothetical protein